MAEGELFLFIFPDFSEDWYYWPAFALAHDLEEARRLVLEGEEGMDRNVNTYERHPLNEPRGWAEW